MMTGADEIRARFEEALASRGSVYVEREIALRESGSAAEPVFEEALRHPDPVGRLLARVLLAWVRGEAVGTLRAVNYLDSLPGFLAEKPYGPDGKSAARYLTVNHGERAAEVMALRLVQSEDWPDWRVEGVISYLETCKQSSTSEALLRFVVETPNPGWRQRAFQALLRMEEPGLQVKVAAEEARLAVLGRRLPPELARWLHPAP